jgi:hypothetical protein
LQMSVVCNCCKDMEVQVVWEWKNKSVATAN